MNKELIEKVSAIREYLTSLTQVTDVKKLADLASQKNFDEMERIYLEITTDMTVEQRSRATWYFAPAIQAEIYLRTGKDFLTGTVTRLVPPLIADLDDLAENLNKGNQGGRP